MAWSTASQPYIQVQSLQTLHGHLIDMGFFIPRLLPTWIKAKQQGPRPMDRARYSGQCTSSAVVPHPSIISCEQTRPTHQIYIVSLFLFRILASFISTSLISLELRKRKTIVYFRALSRAVSHPGSCQDDRYLSLSLVLI